MVASILIGAAPAAAAQSQVGKCDELQVVFLIDESGSMSRRSGGVPPSDPDGLALAGAGRSRSFPGFTPLPDAPGRENPHRRRPLRRPAHLGCRGRTSSRRIRPSIEKLMADLQALLRSAGNPGQHEPACRVPECLVIVRHVAEAGGRLPAPPGHRPDRWAAGHPAPDRISPGRPICASLRSTFRATCPRPATRSTCSASTAAIGTGATTRRSGTP